MKDASGPIDQDTGIFTFAPPRGLRERAQPILLDLFRGAGLEDAEATAARIVDELERDFSEPVRVPLPDLSWVVRLDKKLRDDVARWVGVVVANAWRELVKLACRRAVLAELRRRGIEAPAVH